LWLGDENAPLHPLWLRYSLDYSGSQLGCRGTLWCFEEVLGVLPNIEFSLLFAGTPYETYQ